MLYEATKSQLNRQYEISTRGQKVGYNKKDTVDTVDVNITNMNMQIIQSILQQTENISCHCALKCIVLIP